jgi:hypothetical protein
MTRSITFPKTSADTWTNRETGVLIRRYAGGEYVVEVPMLVPGEFAVSGDLATLNAARDFAKTYAADVVRPLIAKAYTEALADDATIDRWIRKQGCTAKVNSRYPHSYQHDEDMAFDPALIPGYDTCGMTEAEHSEYSFERVRSAEFRADTYDRAARNALYRGMPMDMSIADQELIDEAHEEAIEMVDAKIERVARLTDDSDRPEDERFAGIDRLVRQAKRYHLDGRYGKAIMYARAAERMFVVKDSRRRDEAHAQAMSPCPV